MTGCCRGDPDHVLDRIQACVDGELGPERARAVREHAAACPACGRALARAEAAWAALAACPAPPAPRRVWPGVAARVAGPARPRLLLATGAAAVAAVGLLLGLLAGRMPPAGADGGSALSPASWSGEGSLLVAGGAATLDSLFLASVALAAEAGGEVPR